MTVAGLPKRIIIERGVPGRPKLWRMEIQDEAGRQLDYTLASTRWSVWGMAKLSWRHLRRKAINNVGGRDDRGWRP